MSAAIQAAIDPASTGHVANIQNGITIDATYDAYYVVGITEPYAGRSRWCQTTSAGNAAAQAAEILAVLVA